MTKTIHANKAMFRSYVSGFVLSILLTLAAYILVVRQDENSTFSNTVVAAAILVFALLQFLVQLVFFLHLGRAPRSRTNILVLVFMSVVVLILVFGSIWIMKNLDYSHGGMDTKTPKEVDTYIIEDEGF